MEEQYQNKYALQLEFASVATGRLALRQPPFHEFASFHHALITVFHTNADLFDRHTAAAIGVKFYIQKAAVYDLETGLLAAATSQPGKDASMQTGSPVHLTLGPGAIEHYLWGRYHPAGHDDLAGYKPATLLMFAFDPALNMLYPAESFAGTYTELMNRTIDKKHPPDHLDWSVERKGWDPAGPMLIGGINVHRPIHDLYLFEREAPALRMLIALGDTVGTHVDTSQLVPLAEHVISYGPSGKEKTAGISVIHPPVGATHDQIMTCGRFLHAEDSWKDLLARAKGTLDKSMMSLQDSASLKLGYWSATQPGQLKPTDIAERIRASLEARPLTTPEYVTAIHQRSLDYPQWVENRQADKNIFAHTSDLLTALARMVNIQWHMYVPAAAKAEGKGLYTAASYVTDRKGKVIAAVKVQSAPLGTLGEGIYFCFHRKILSDALWDLVGLSRLLNEAAAGSMRMDGLCHIKVADVRGTEIELKTIGTRLRLGLQFCRMQETMTSRPAYLRPSPPLVKSTDKYLLAIEWAPAGGARQKYWPATVFARSYPTADKALAALALVQKVARGSEQFATPLELKKATLRHQKTNQPLVVKSFTKKGATRYNASLLLNDSERKAYQKHIGELPEAGLSPPNIPPRPRQRRDDPGAGPDKTRSPRR